MTDDALGREIRQMREDVRARLDAIQQQLTALLPREVYEAHRNAMQRQLDGVEADVRALDASIEAAERDRIGTRRWAVSAVVVPILSIVVGIILFALRP